MTTVVSKSENELRAWREELLASAAMPWERLVELAGEFALDADERNIYESVRAINFLLDDGR